MKRIPLFSKLVLSFCRIALFLSCGGAPLFAQLDYLPQDGVFIFEDDLRTPYENSFSGGFNAPRPQFWDINQDGILDILIQRDQKSVLFFEGSRSSGIPSFNFVPGFFDDLDPGFWFRLSDINSDGLLSLFIAREFAKIEHYVWDSTAESFQLISGALLQDNSNPLSFESGSIPEFADIDCDGDKDLFLPISDGTLVFYSNIGKDSSGSPIFQLTESRFQDILINVTGSAERSEGIPIRSIANSASDSSSERHGAGSVSFVDYDLDNDLDLVWGDFFSSGLYLFPNEGTCLSPNISIPADPSDYARIPFDAPLKTSGFNLSDWIDLSGDGLLDLVVSIQGGAFALGNDKDENFYYYERISEDEFELKTKKLINGIDVGQDSFPELVDLNGDQTMDLFIGNSFNLSNGTSEARLWYLKGLPCVDCSFVLDVESRDFMAEFIPNFDMNNVLRIKPSFVDIDNDGDQDLFLGRNNGTLIFFKNEGTAQNFSFSDGQREYSGIDVRAESSPEFFDYDGDGDLDLFIGSSSGAVYHYVNDGDRENASFSLATNSFLDIDVGTRSVPSFGDADNDGVKDLHVFGEFTNLIYKGALDNLGQHSFTRLGEDFIEVPTFASASSGPLVSPEGKDHLVVGSVEGGLLLFGNGFIGGGVAIGEELPQSSIKIDLFPNPSSGKLNISINELLPGNSRIEIVDALGRLIHSQIAENRLVISIERSGLYLLRLVENGNTIGSQKVVVRR